jgi:hypothetical protein
MAEKRSSRREFHPIRCSMTVFGSPVPPDLPGKTGETLDGYPPEP